MTAAIVATVIGPFALWARLGMTKRPKLHRAFGYAWVTMMLVTAVSAIFIRSGLEFNVYGFSPIHLLIPVTFLSLFGAFRFLMQGNIVGHRTTMIRLYVGPVWLRAFSRLYQVGFWAIYSGNSFIVRLNMH